jgi:hypothetical protein
VQQVKPEADRAESRSLVRPHRGLRGSLLSMTDGDGTPMGSAGDKIAHKLQGSENPDVIAKRLRLQICRRIRSGDAVGFNRRLGYPKVGYTEPN